MVEWALCHLAIGVAQAYEYRVCGLRRREGAAAGEQGQEVDDNEEAVTSGSWPTPRSSRSGKICPMDSRS